MVLMAVWLGMPFSELCELRRRDIRLDDGVVCVRRAVAEVRGGYEVTTPNTRAGMRDIAIPVQLTARIAEHLEAHVGRGRESLLFPSMRNPDRHLGTVTLYRMLHRAFAAAGLPDLRVADLRRMGPPSTRGELVARRDHLNGIVEPPHGRG